MPESEKETTEVRGLRRRALRQAIAAARHFQGDGEINAILRSLDTAGIEVRPKADHPPLREALRAKLDEMEDPNYDGSRGTYDEGWHDALDDVRKVLDSLPAEPQPQEAEAAEKVTQYRAVLPFTGPGPWYPSCDTAEAVMGSVSGYVEQRTVSYCQPVRRVEVGDV